ncbi:hypothetical protein Misp04_26610 [Micromonospora sp. NBRC 101691]|nr:hypothetical protein Misp04_26610 [Micromonospora sp. NBRC 101691]
MWHTPQDWTRTTASPGPGSGTTIVATSTGAPLRREITPRTSWLTLSPSFSVAPPRHGFVDHVHLATYSGVPTPAQDTRERARKGGRRGIAGRSAGGGPEVGDHAAELLGALHLRQVAAAGEEVGTGVG